jgi:diguanylate cyclase (GGDEF)-like protein
MLFNLLFAAALIDSAWPLDAAGYTRTLLPLTFALAALIAVRAGMQSFLRAGNGWREGLAVMVLALAADQVLLSRAARAADFVLISSLALAWLAGRLCYQSFTPLRRDFTVLSSVAVLAPFGVWALWLLVRAALAFGLAPADSELTRWASDDDALAPTWIALAALLGMNMACLGLVIARLLRHLRDLTLRDALTGIMNRRAVEMSLTSEYEKLRRHGQIFCVATIDLDRFSQVHASFGRAASDAALFHAVQVIKGQLRNCDAIGRVGDEEFLVILPMTRLHGGREAGERIRAALADAPFAWDGRAVSVTASLGVAECFNPEESAPTLLRRADHALFAAKNGGRNRVEVAPN